MRVNTRIVFAIKTSTVIERESFEYIGPVAQCCGGGDGDGPGDAPSGDQGDVSGGSGGNVAGGGAASGPGTIGEPGQSGHVGDVEAAEAAGDTSSADTSGSAVAGGAGDPVSYGFSLTQAVNVGTTVTGLTGNPVIGLISGVIGGIIGGSEGLGGQGSSPSDVGIHGPDQQKRAAAVSKAGIKEETTGTPTLADVKAGAKDKAIKKARSRPQTILTSPLGLRSEPSIRRATLLGG